MHKLNFQDPDEREIFFLKLYAANHKSLRSMIYYALRGKNPSATDDILQEVFKEAFVQVNELMKHPNPEGWLVITARNKLRELQRRASSREVSIEDCTYEPVYREDQYACVELKLMMKNILTPHELDLLIRHYVEKRPAKELALEEQITVNAFKVKMCRIRKKLRQSLSMT